MTKLPHPAAWTWQDAAAALLAGAACLAILLFLYWNTVTLLPDEHFLDGHDPLGTLAVLRLGLFLPLALLAGWLGAAAYAALARHPGIANLLPGAAFAVSLFVLIELRWVQSPYPGWFMLSRALLVFLALPAGWWLLNRRRHAA